MERLLLRATSSTSNTNFTQAPLSNGMLHFYLPVPSKMCCFAHILTILMKHCITYDQTEDELQYMTESYNI